MKIKLWDDVRPTVWAKDTEMWQLLFDIYDYYIQARCGYGSVRKGLDSHSWGRGFESGSGHFRKCSPKDGGWMTAPKGVESSSLVGLAPGEVPQCWLLERTLHPGHRVLLLSWSVSSAIPAHSGAEQLHEVRSLGYHPWATRNCPDLGCSIRFGEGKASAKCPLYSTAMKFRNYHSKAMW